MLSPTHVVVLAPSAAVLAEGGLTAAVHGLPDGIRAVIVNLDGCAGLAPGAVRGLLSAVAEGRLHGFPLVVAGLAGPALRMAAACEIQDQAPCYPTVAIAQTAIEVGEMDDECHSALFA